jgi:hypothetical protein
MRQVFQSGRSAAQWREHQRSAAGIAAAMKKFFPGAWERILT